MSIEIKNISKHFAKFPVLEDINLHVPTGELVALLGPSGCGKTTLLRIIAGLETPDTGAVYFDGEDGTRRTVSERKVGFVFQHYALFRHMTIFENVAFGLRVRPPRLRPSREEIEHKVNTLLHLVQLESVGHRYPTQLSGGQRQRIALARALAVEPKLLLLDEPFGALDANVRQELRRWLRRLHDELHVTSIFVTHDQEEALEVAHRVVVMNDGKIEQVGTPEEVYDNPANPFVYNFLGKVNLFPLRLNKGQAEIGKVKIQVPEYVMEEEKDAVGYVRPTDIEVERKAKDDGTAIPVTVSHIQSIGAQVHIEFKKEQGEVVEVEINKDRYQELALKVGDKVFIKPKHVKVFVGALDYSI